MYFFSVYYTCITAVVSVTQGLIFHNYTTYFSALTKFKCDLTLLSIRINSDVFKLGYLHN